LLAEYEEQTEPQQDGDTEETSEPQEPQGLDDIIEELDTSWQVHQQKLGLLEFADALRAERDRFDLRNTLADIRSALPEAASLSDGTILSWLIGLYTIDPRVQCDWDRRHEHPGHWDSVDPDLTEMREAVAFAVRGGSGAPTAPGPMPDIHHMTDREFAKFTEENFGYRPAHLDTWGGQ
jgi:hypothetical protein